MTRFNKTEKFVHNQQHPKLPIKYWQAIQCNTVIDEDNSITILKHRYSHTKGITFKPVR